MANQFKTNLLVLSKQTLSATGSNLYLNGLLIGSGLYAPLDALTNTGALLSAVRVTGSNIINVANFTGIGGAIVFASGSQIFISGGAGGGGGGVSSLNTLQNAINLTGAGNVLVSVAGQLITVSGISTGDLFQTGAILQSEINSLSGFATGISGALQTNYGKPVTDLGARGNGINNDTYAIQQTINFCQNSPIVKEVQFPPGTYYTTGILWVTGNSIILNGYNLSNIVTTGENDYQKLYVSGASGVNIKGLNFLCGRTTGTNAQYSGIITATNTKYLNIEQCFIRDTLGVGILYNQANYCPTVFKNKFQNYQIGIYSQPLAGSGHVDKANFSDNIFLESWGAIGQDYFGGIKLQAPINFSGYSRGNIIDNNIFINSSEMGIEIWGNIADTIISNNYAEGTLFGISVANNSKNITVSNNTIKGAGLYGIEIADSYGVTVVGNTIDGATGNSGVNLPITYDGIIVNGLNSKPNYVNIVGNVVKNCSHSNIINYNARHINIIGNTLIQSGAGANSNFYNQQSSFVNFSNNSLSNNTGSYFIMLDADSTINTSGITISNNDFNGAVSQWGILYYNNNNLGTNTDVLIENNRTYNVQYCFFGMINTADAPPSYAIHRNNFGPSGAGYSIPDYSVPAGLIPYGTANLQAGFQYYGTQTYTVGSGGITGAGIWVCVWSGGGGTVNNPRIYAHIDTTVDNNSSTLEAWAQMMPYTDINGNLTHTLMALPQGKYFSNNFAEIRTQRHDTSNSTNSLWLRLTPSSTGTSGERFTFKYSEQNSLISPYATYTEPALKAGDVSIILTGGNYQEWLKTTPGLLITNLNNNSDAGAYTQMGFQSTTHAFQFGMGNSGETNFGVANSLYIYDAKAGLMRLVIDSSGRLGLGTNTPSAFFHSTGTIRTDGVFQSGATDITNLYYPRSNPSGYTSSANVYVTGLSFNFNINDINTYTYVWTGNANSTGILPAISTASGYHFSIKNKASANKLLISGNIDNQQNFTVYPLDFYTFYSDGQTWEVG